MNNKIPLVTEMTILLWLLTHPALADENKKPQLKLKTAKERLSTKASDPQRVNNCKVPVEKWGEKKRSNICGKTDSNTR